MVTQNFEGCAVYGAIFGEPGAIPLSSIGIGARFSFVHSIDRVFTKKGAGRYVDCNGKAWRTSDRVAVVTR